MKTYLLAIRDLLDADNGEMCGHWSRGHHAEPEFQAAALAAGYECAESYRSRQEWLRYVPKPAEEGWRAVLTEAEAGQRGAFPATLAEYGW